MVVVVDSCLSNLLENSVVDVASGCIYLCRLISPVIYCDIFGIADSATSLVISIGLHLSLKQELLQRSVLGALGAMWPAVIV